MKIPTQLKPISKVAAYLLFFMAAYLLGMGAASLTSSKTTVATSSEANSNWGLSFQEDGKAPVGNASCEELKQYHAAYMDDTEEKVIYLTFDCGYENGNLPAI